MKQGVYTMYKRVLVSLLIATCSLLICNCAGAPAPEPLPIDPAFDAFMAKAPEPLKNVPQKGHGDSVPYVLYSPDGKRFATVSLSDANEVRLEGIFIIWPLTIKIWDAETYRVLVAIEGDKKTGSMNTDVVRYRHNEATYPIDLKWSPEGRFLLCGRTMYDSWTGEKLYDFYEERWDHPNNRVSTPYIFSSDGRYLLDYSYEWEGNKGYFIIRMLNTLDKKRIPNRRFTINHNGRTMRYRDRNARGNDDYDVEIFTPGPPGSDLIAITFKQGTTFYSMDSGKTLAPLFNTAVYPKYNTVAFGHNFYAISERAFPYDPIEKQVESQTIYLYKVPSGEPAGACKVSVGFTHSLRFSPDGTQLFAESSNGEMYVFDPTTGKIIDILDLSARNRRIIEAPPQFINSSRLYNFIRMEGEE